MTLAMKSLILYVRWFEKWIDYLLMFLFCFGGTDTGMKSIVNEWIN